MGQAHTDADRRLGTEGMLWGSQEGGGVGEREVGGVGEREALRLLGNVFYHNRCIDRDDDNNVCVYVCVRACVRACVCVRVCI